MRIAALIGSALLLFSLVACGGVAEPAIEPELVPVPLKAEDTPVPVSFRVPDLGIDTNLIDLGRDAKTGELETPDVHTPMVAGWYHEGYRPGEPGPAVIAAHVDGEVNGRKGSPGLFLKLHTLKPGADIFVKRADGTEVHFKVSKVDSIPKVECCERIYQANDKPQLRLVTCGGDFDHSARSYKNNIVAWADLVA